MGRRRGIGFILGVALAAILGARAATAAPLTIGYSDWPGWVAWQVAIDKGWLKEAGLDVKFQWFDYSASMDAFAAGKIDANLMTNGDTLVTGSGGGKGVIIMATDYSNGNDMVIGKPGIKNIKALKGKKVGRRSRPRRSSAAAGRVQKERHEPERRHAGQFEDQRVAAGAGVRPGRCRRLLATDFRPGHEGGARLASGLDVRTSRRA